MTITRRSALRAAGAAAAAPLMAGCAGNDAYDAAARRTWRHADGEPAGERALQRELVRYATLAANGHNTQPWRFRLRAGAIDILPDFARRTPVVDPDDHHLWASLGCATENLAQAAAAFGGRAEVTVDAQGVHVALARAAARRTPLFDALVQRQSTRAEYDGRPLEASVLAQLSQAASDAQVQAALLTDRGQLGRVRDLVIAGNSAQMADPAFVAELKAWLRFNGGAAAASGDGLYAASSGNPTAPAWIGALLFGLFFTPKAENDKYARQMRSSAGVVVFAAERAEPAGWVAAGRACQRFQLQATALGVRSAFINQPVEVAALRAELAQAAGLPGRRPDLVLRFGRGPTLPPSLRRPVDAVLAA